MQIIAVHSDLDEFIASSLPYQPQTRVWENFTAIEKDFMEPLREALKVTRIQYQAELTRKRDEMAGNKSKNVFSIND